MAIDKVFQDATADDIESGRQWYPGARGVVYAMARQYGVTPEKAAGVVAALSQRCQWSKNIEHARACFEKRPIGGLPAAANKAIAIRDGANIVDTLGPNAHKIRAFYLALLGDMDAVVIDTWIIKALKWPTKSYTRIQYEKLADIIRRQARRAGMTAAAYQATVWVVILGAAD